MRDNPRFSGIKKAELIAIEVAAPANAGRLPSQMGCGSMAQAMGYPAVIMLLTNTLAIVKFETPRLGCHTGAKTASLDENCCSFARLWTTAAAAQNTRAEKPPALRTGCLSGSRPLLQLLMAKWTADEDDKLRGAVDEFGAGIGAPENTWKGPSVQFNWARHSERVGRTAEACASRWWNFLAPGLETGEWTASDDAANLLSRSLFGLSTYTLAPLLRRGPVPFTKRWDTIKKAAEPLGLTLAPGEAVSADAVARVLRALPHGAASYDATAVADALESVCRAFTPETAVPNARELAEEVGNELAALPPPPVDRAPKRRRVRKSAAPTLDAAELAKKLKVVELRAELEAAGADTKGLKAVLIERLVGVRRAAAAVPSFEENRGAYAAELAARRREVARRRKEELEGHLAAVVDAGRGALAAATAAAERALAATDAAAAQRRKDELDEALAALRRARDADAITAAKACVVAALGAIVLPRPSPFEKLQLCADGAAAAAEDALIAREAAFRRAIAAASVETADAALEEASEYEAGELVVASNGRDRAAEALVLARELYAVWAAYCAAGATGVMGDVGARADLLSLMVRARRANYNAALAALIAARRGPARTLSARTSIFVPGAPPNSLVLTSLPPPHKWWWWWWWWWLCWCEWCIICGALSFLVLERPQQPLLIGNGATFDYADLEVDPGDAALFSDVGAVADGVDTRCGGATDVFCDHSPRADAGAAYVADDDPYCDDTPCAYLDDAAGFGRDAYGPRGPCSGAILSAWHRGAHGIACPLGAHVDYNDVERGLGDDAFQPFLGDALGRGEFRVNYKASNLRALDHYLDKVAHHASTPRFGDCWGQVALSYVRAVLALPQSDSGTVPPYAHIDAALIAAWGWPVVSACCSDTGNACPAAAVRVPPPDWNGPLVTVRVARAEGGRVTVVLGYDAALRLPSAVLWLSARAVDVPANPLSRASRAQMTLREKADAVLVLGVGLLAGSKPFYMGDRGATGPSTAIAEGSLCAAAAAGDHWTDHHVVLECASAQWHDRLLQFSVYATLLVVFQEAKFILVERSCMRSDAARECARMCSGADRVAAGALVDRRDVDATDWAAACRFLAANPDGTTASRDALNALRATAFRGVVVHVETRLHDRAGPYAERMEAALRVMLGDERVDGSLRQAEASRKGWVTRRGGEG